MASRILLCLFCITLLWSCQDAAIYSKKIEIENANWPYDKLCSFDFEISDSLQVYDLILKIEHDREFPNQNFYLQFHTSYPDGKKTKDVVSMELANEFGQWNGDCSSDKCIVPILLRSKTKFKPVGSYRIELEQFNRIESIKGIYSLELILENSKI